MADNDIAIKVEHISKNFVLPHEKISSMKSAFTSMFRRNRTKEAQHALKDVSFEIQKGEFFGIVGRNGSGKSTMLKILAGIYQPTKGKVAVHGKLVPFIELGVGFNPELTGRENVYLNGAMLGFSRKQVDAMYDDIVAFAELERFMDQKLKNYSSGMQVRLAFSMATRSQADILLVDEVLAVGDADFQRKCFEYFKTLKKDKKTVVFVSHDMDAIREFCDRAVLIEQNELHMAGSSKDVATEYSRLFTEHEAASSGKKSPEDTRWGNGALRTATTRATVKAGMVHVHAQFKAERAIEHPIVGFSIKNANGVAILGTNTKLQKEQLGIYAAGDKCTLDWSLPDILADGTYTVDIAVLEADAITVCDWWEDCTTFAVRKERPSIYDINPKIEVAIDVQKKA